ncbi:ParB N-terminal domain-containing protein, partial [Candidatus Woesearchaeota archaeon]|nr:ParB N-terminal domain-containing protein [Candidatus Woesearchaeota archaeon]
MDLEAVLKSNDEEILEFMHKTPQLPHPQALHPEKFLYVPTTILLKLFEQNYRTHTFKFTNELGESIRKYGQLEPILLTRNGEKIIDTDGRGRFWSNFKKGADYMPVEILYNVPPLLKLQMEIDLNATKTKIDNEDIAFLAKDIFDGLAREYGTLSDDGTAKIITPQSKSKSLRLTAEVMCREKKTISQYLTVANMNPKVLEENQKRRNSQSFKRLHAIAKAFPEHKDQWNFYQLVREKEERAKQIKKEKAELVHATKEQVLKQKLDNIAAEDTTLNQHMFYGLLLIKKEEQKLESFMVREQEQTNSIKHNPAYKTAQKTTHYVFGARQLFRRFPELKKGFAEFQVNNRSMREYLENSATKIVSIINQGTPRVQHAIEKFLASNKEETFEEIIMRKTAKEELEEPVIVRAVGDTPEFIPLEQIVIDEEQVRSHYKKQASNVLSQKIAQYGQVKPGLVIPVGSQGKKLLYKVVVGNSRYQACVQAGTGFFKAFIRYDLLPYEIKIYQAIEDMFEQDTVLERSAMLHRIYHLAESKAKEKNQQYSMDEFLKENRHLGRPSKLKRLMSIMDLPQVYQDMIGSQLITPDGALAVNQLPEE